MKIKPRIDVMLFVIASTFVGSALAAVSAEKAKQLGGPVLTPFGAEKAGNKEGTIPAYTGEGVNPPAGYDPKEPTRRPDPYADEKPLFSITAQNAAQYADRLDGLVEMFKRYPDFRMDIYPTHRTAAFPKFVLDNSIKNATACKGIDNDLKLEGCYGGVPFPIPENGAQAMWNHTTSFEAEAWAGKIPSWVVSNNGSKRMTNMSEIWQQLPYYNSKSTTPAAADSIYWQVRIDYLAPARSVGEKLVLIDYLDSLNLGRRAYSYIPGQRRVKLAPDLSYDTPSPLSGGIFTMDEGKAFLGALDRYDWKLVGKKEKYIIYNNFKMTAHTAACSSDGMLTKNFLNPDCVRWELHRVWKVDAKLKPGFRHIYHKRLFFWDEDGYASGVAENYDAAGKLYRLDAVLSWPFYANEGGGMISDNLATYDLQTGNYVVSLPADPGMGWYLMKPREQLFYSPEVLAGEGIR